jgi:hypothetical protein
MEERLTYSQGYLQSNCQTVKHIHDNICKPVYIDRHMHNITVVRLVCKAKDQNRMQAKTYDQQKTKVAGMRSAGLYVEVCGK